MNTMGQAARTFHGAGAGPAALSMLIFLIGLAIIVYWMVVAWRAMRAHERIADAMEYGFGLLMDRRQNPPQAGGAFPSVAQDAAPQNEGGGEQV